MDPTPAIRDPVVAENAALLLERAPDAILVHRDGRITYANAAAVRLFAARDAWELVGKPPLELLHSDYHPAIRERIDRLLAGGTHASSIEQKIVRLDGKLLDVEVAASAFEDERGRAIQVVLRDITHRRLMETAIRASEDRLVELLELAEERALAQRRLEEQLREGDRRKSDFLALLSHELRNPLAAIQNGLVLLERTPPASAPSLHAREVIRRQIGHVAKLVDDLLDISRIDHGKITLERTRLDAREVVRGACDDVRGRFEERGLALRVDVASEPLWVDADATRLAQIVGNLLANALKFTPPGGSVEVTVRKRGRNAELRVRDDGTGIEPDLLEAIFEPFRQSERTRPSALGGMGLGLSLVKNLAVLHGGTAEAHSEGLGRGAELVVTLPLAPEPAVRIAPVRPARTRPLAVLVVEDNVDAGETLLELLELQGHETRLAGDAAAARAAFASAAPEVVVCDIGLPDATGYELLRDLRALPGGRDAYAVALTGYAQPDDVRRAKDAGFDAHLAKPPPLGALDAVLAEAASRRARRAG